MYGERTKQQQQGLAVLEHYQAITDQHLETIYSYLNKRLEDAQNLAIQGNFQYFKRKYCLRVN